MSKLYYFACDSALAECPNPYLERMSVNEALARGVELDLSIFPDSFDFDCPNTILYAESDDAFDHPNIYLEDSRNFCEDIGTEKAYCAILEWDYCAKTAHEVYAYIQKQMETAAELELWNVWLGDHNIPQTVEHSSVRFKELTPEHLKAFYQKANTSRLEGENYCLTVIK